MHMTARRALLEDNVQSRKETPCRRTGAPQT